MSGTYTSVLCLSAYLRAAETHRVVTGNASGVARKKYRSPRASVHLALTCTPSSLSFSLPLSPSKTGRSRAAKERPFPWKTKVDPRCACNYARGRNAPVWRARVIRYSLFAVCRPDGFLRDLRGAMYIGDGLLSLILHTIQINDIHNRAEFAFSAFLCSLFFFFRRVCRGTAWKKMIYGAIDATVLQP